MVGYPNSWQTNGVTFEFKGTQNLSLEKSIMNLFNEIHWHLTNDIQVMTFG